MLVGKAALRGVSRLWERCGFRIHSFAFVERIVILSNS